MFKNVWNSFKKQSEQPRVFVLVRNGDESGTSGTGRVLDGIVFPNGTVAVCWDTKNNPDSRVDVGSISVFDSYDDFLSVHVSQHPDNRSEIKWLL